MSSSLRRGFAREHGDDGWDTVDIVLFLAALTPSLITPGCVQVITNDSKDKTKAFGEYLSNVLDEIMPLSLPCPY